MSKNDSYTGGSTTFHLGSDWVAKDKPVDAETVFKRERKAEAAKKATEEWLAETAPNQDPDRQRANVGRRSHKLLLKKRIERKKKGGDGK
ncbi:hypothetical protein N9H60_01485 [Flavimaricola sp.]|nr:hypothetical protein [Flavimaricola sp.]MDA9019835.1 hypothetical protein [Flavimaricola sp.]